MYFLASSLEGANHYVSDESRSDSNGYVVGEWHQDDREEARDCNSHVIPVDSLDSGHHQESDDD